MTCAARAPTIGRDDHPGERDPEPGVGVAVVAQPFREVPVAEPERDREPDAVGVDLQRADVEYDRDRLQFVPPLGCCRGRGPAFVLEQYGRTDRRSERRRPGRGRSEARQSAASPAARARRASPGHVGHGVEHRALRLGDEPPEHRELPRARGPRRCSRCRRCCRSGRRAR